MKFDYQHLHHEIATAGYDLRALAHEVDLSERSFKRKLRAGGSFTQNQICRIVDALNLSVIKIQACFFTLNS